VIGPIESGVEILLVEDDPSDLQLIMRAFKKMNLANRVLVARDGEEALQMILGSGSEPGQPLPAYRLILLDLKLPKVDGIEVLRRIKADARTQTMPVVVLTSSREDRDIEKCYELGVNSYVHKPVNIEGLVEAVHTLGMYWLLVNQAPGH
jgi:CheY-like chemotaxis protein